MFAAVIGSRFFEESKECIALEELMDTPLILDRRLEKMVIDSCKKSGFSPRVLCKSDDVRSSLLMANTGIGAAILPKSAIELIPNSNLKYIEILEHSLETNPAIIWMKDRYLSAAAKHFLETFTEA